MLAVMFTCISVTAGSKLWEIFSLSPTDLCPRWREWDIWESSISLSFPSAFTSTELLPMPASVEMSAVAFALTWKTSTWQDSSDAKMHSIINVMHNLNFYDKKSTAYLGDFFIFVNIKCNNLLKRQSSPPLVFWESLIWRGDSEMNTVRLYLMFHWAVQKAKKKNTLLPVIYQKRCL